MSCTRPRFAIQWLQDGVPCANANGDKRPSFINKREGLIIESKYQGDFARYCLNAMPNSVPDVDYRPLVLPCGKCSACKLQYGKNWSVRGMLEYLAPDYHFWQDGKFIDVPHCFLTLTIDDEHLVTHGKFVRKDVLQKFFKRLRKDCGVHVRYLACGEYGSINFRPHYHAIIYGYYPHDATFQQINATGDTVYYSAYLSKKWTFGNIFIGDVTFESISYVAGYVAKKVEMLSKLCDFDFQYKVHPPFIIMSRKPGLGAGFFKAYTSDFFNDDIFINNKHCQLPRYFLKKLEETYPQVCERIKELRVKAAETASIKDPKTLQRLENLEELYNLRLSKKVRNL